MRENETHFVHPTKIGIKGVFYSLVFGKSPVNLGKERRPRRRAFGAAARRCRSFQSRPAAAAALELLKFGSKSKATLSRGCGSSSPSGESDALLRRRRVCVVCVFSACVQKQGKTVVLMRKEISD